MDLVNRALYTMPNSPAMNVNTVNFGPEAAELKCDWRGGEEAGMRGCKVADYLHFAWKNFLCVHNSIA